MRGGDRLIGYEHDLYRYYREREAREKEEEETKETKEVTDRHYHWWQEPLGARMTIKTAVLRKFIKDKMREEGARSFHDLWANKMELARSKWNNYYNWLSMDKRRVEVGTLKRFCNEHGVSLASLEEERIFADRDFPIKNRPKEVARIRSHLINEGSIERKQRYVSNFLYDNQDPVMHWYFKKRVEELGGKFRGPRLQNGGLRSSVDPTTSRFLSALRSFDLNTCLLDPLFETNQDVKQYHFQTTLTEEGHSVLFLERGYARMNAGIARSVGITALLPNNFIHSLETGTIRVRKVRDPNIQKIIRKNPPPLLLQEKAILALEELRLHPSNIRKRKDGRVTVDWHLYTKKTELVDAFHNEYGMLPGTWKALVFNRRYQLYREFRGKKLSEEDKQRIEKLNEKYPSKVPRWWVEKKIRELFPKKDWVKDPREVAKVFSHRKR